MPAPSGKIKLSGALSASGKSPSTAGAVPRSAPGAKSAGQPDKRANLPSVAASPSDAKTTKKAAQRDAANPPGSPTTSSKSALFPGGPWLWCLLGLAIGLSIWLGGRAYLRRELAAQLSTAQSEAVALESIDALLRLDADATIDVSRGLAHPEFMVANAAYRALTGQIDAWRTLKPAEQLRRMQQVIAELERMPAELDQDHRILVTGLASRIYAEALGNREAGVADLLANCKRVMGAPDSSGNETTTAVAADIESSAMRIARSSLRPQSSGTLADESRITQSLGDADAGDSGESISPVPPPLPPIGTPSNRQIIQRSINDDNSQPSAAGQLPDQSQPYPSQSGAAATEDQSSNMPRMSNASSNRLSLTSSRTMVQLTASPTKPPVGIQDHDMHSAEPTAGQIAAAEATIEGMEQLPIDQLVRLLNSLQPRVGQAAALMLRRKGMTEQNLDLAIQLAKGTPLQRQELLQSIAARDDLDPRPWLLWMAADGEDQVREHAVGLLGPLMDNEVRRQLRLMLNKERDEQVAATIRQVLVK